MENLTNEMREYVKSFIAKQYGSNSFSFDIASLFGDGSDRKLYRVKYDKQSAVFVTNAGVVKLDAICENDSFNYICRHLRNVGVLTPEIYSYSKEKGWFILEDLGDETLFVRVKSLTGANEVEKLYQQAIDVLLTMQIEGAKGFNVDMCYATKYYDKDLIINYESGYFFREFLNCYLKLDLEYSYLADEFNLLADEALKNTDKFFLHRDFQARNIMIKDEKLRIIDFQGGRIGPLQYDLAALVIDAFVNLPFDMKDKLFDYYMKNLKNIMKYDEEDFRKRLYYTAIHRAMQALGAYSFLTLKKSKRYFAEHMGKGVNNIRVFLEMVEGDKTYPKLNSIIQKVYDKFY